MTNTPAVVATDDQTPAVLCPTCGHVLSAHDKISARWCLATTSTGAQRDCVCPETARVARDLSYTGGITPNRK